MFDARDPFGHPIRVQRAPSAAAVAGFVEGLLGHEPCIADVQAAAAHDASPIVQACAAALQLLDDSPAGVTAARAHLARAAEAGLLATPREQQFAAAVGAWADGDLAGAIALHESTLAAHPRDLCSLALAQRHALELGDAPTMLRLALAALPAAQDIAWAHGLAAFAWAQCHRLDEAERAARHALAMRPAEPWAQHALAHVMLAGGRLREAAAFLAAVSPQWQRLGASMRTRHWGQLALLRLELGEDGAALTLYDREAWGVDKTCAQEQAGAVALLSRLELAGVAVGERWDELAGWLAPREHDHLRPLFDLHCLYGLARAGRPEGAHLLAHLERLATEAPAARRAAWQQVAVPAGRGLLAHARGEWREAAAHLAPALPHLAAIGGSHVQREWFEQLHLDALQRAGDLAAAQQRLQPQANAQPQSERLRRRLHEVYAALSLPGLAHH